MPLVHALLARYPTTLAETAKRQKHDRSLHRRTVNRFPIRFCMSGAARWIAYSLLPLPGSLGLNVQAVSTAAPP